MKKTALLSAAAPYAGVRALAYRVGERWRVRTASFDFHDACTRLQVKNRNRMAYVVHLSSVFAPVLPDGFPYGGKNVSAYNLFVRENIRKVEVDEARMDEEPFGACCRIAPSRIVCANGTLEPPRLKAEYVAAGNSIHLTMVGSVPGGVALRTVLVVYQEGYPRVYRVEVDAEELVDYLLQLPFVGTPERIHLYAFNRSLFSMSVSPSVYVAMDGMEVDDGTR